MEALMVDLLTPTSCLGIYWWRIPQCFTTGRAADPRVTDGVESYVCLRQPSCCGVSSPTTLRGLVYFGPTV